MCPPDSEFYPAPIPATAYLAAPGFADDLAKELELAGQAVVSRYGDLFVTTQPAIEAAWAQNVWLNPVVHEIESIKKAAALLKGQQRNWAAYSYQLHGRTRLIEAELPHISFKPHIFGQPAPSAPLGAFTLIDDKHLLASARCTSPFKNGEVQFVEDKTTPPNRAYLKLWEFFTVTGIPIKPGAVCLDLGACPGGWTWVLQSMGARVISVDKAPLAPHIAKLPRVRYVAGSAFGLEPKTHEKVDWLFSDIACYPSRLLSLVKRWLEADKATNFCCTIKLQGETDHAAVRAFAAIPGSHIRHLSCNKHELTWYLVRG